MDTENLQLFVLAAELLNISAAGKRLNMGPAVASARLAKLEKSVGADLLHRSTRKVSLSLEGVEFLPFAKEILAQEEAARAALGNGNAVAKGTLRFTAPSSFAQLYIAPILPKFIDQYPEVTLDLRLSDSRYDLIEGSFDLALRNSAIQDTSMKGRKLAEDTRILCASPQYLEKYGTPKHPRELANHRLISFGSQKPRELLGHNGETWLFDPLSAVHTLTVDDGLSQKISTIAGVGISANSLWSVHQELKSQALVQVLPEFEVNDHSTLWLIYPSANVISSKVRVFIDFLTNEIGRPPPWLAKNN